MKIPLAAPPGEKWMYSIAVAVQVKLIEALSGIRNGNDLRNRVAATVKDVWGGLPIEARLVAYVDGAA